MKTLVITGWAKALPSWRLYNLLEPEINSWGRLMNDRPGLVLHGTNAGADEFASMWSQFHRIDTEEVDTTTGLLKSVPVSAFEDMARRGDLAVLLYSSKDKASREFVKIWEREGKDPADLLVFDMDNFQ